MVVVENNSKLLNSQNDLIKTIESNINDVNNKVAFIEQSFTKETNLKNKKDAFQQLSNFLKVAFSIEKKRLRKTGLLLINEIKLSQQFVEKDFMDFTINVNKSIDNFMDDITRLKSQSLEQEVEMQTVLKKMVDINENIADVEMKASQNEIILRDISGLGQTSQTTTLVFTYGLTTDFSGSSATILPLNKEITSAGSKLKLTSGKFVCYTGGIYKFQVYSLTIKGTEAWLELYKNYDLVASIWARIYRDRADSGNAVVLELAAGDTVYLKSRHGRTIGLYGASDKIFTTFTGVYLGRSFQDDTGVTPAFFVAADTGLAVRGSNTVIFNKVITDIANIYDKTSGIVTVKSSGVYIFHVFSLSAEDKEIYQELYHNSDFVCSLYNTAKNEWSNAGNTAILHVKAGDSLAVRAASGYNNVIYGTSDQVYSTFSGAILATESEINERGARVIAFTSGLSRDWTFPGGSKVIFDQVIINLGQAYDQRTGDFSAPVAGFYEFTFHALAQKKKSIWLDLYRNYQ